MGDIQLMSVDDDNLSEYLKVASHKQQIGYALVQNIEEIHDKNVARRNELRRDHGVRTNIIPRSIAEMRDALMFDEWSALYAGLSPYHQECLAEHERGVEEFLI